jgi:hypothetical protein
MCRAEAEADCQRKRDTRVFGVAILGIAHLIGSPLLPVVLKR